MIVDNSVGIVDNFLNCGHMSDRNTDIYLVINRQLSDSERCNYGHVSVFLCLISRFSLKAFKGLIRQLSYKIKPFIV